MRKKTKKLLFYLSIPFIIIFLFLAYCSFVSQTFVDIQGIPLQTYNENFLGSNIVITTPIKGSADTHQDQQICGVNDPGNVVLYNYYTINTNDILIGSSVGGNIPCGPNGVLIEGLENIKGYTTTISYTLTSVGLHSSSSLSTTQIYVNDKLLDEITMGDPTNSIYCSKYQTLVDPLFVDCMNAGSLSVTIRKTITISNVSSIKISSSSGRGGSSADATITFNKIEDNNYIDVYKLINNECISSKILSTSSIEANTYTTLEECENHISGGGNGEESGIDFIFFVFPIVIILAIVFVVLLIRRYK